MGRSGQVFFKLRGERTEVKGEDTVVTVNQRFYAKSGILSLNERAEDFILSIGFDVNLSGCIYLQKSCEH